MESVLFGMMHHTERAFCWQGSSIYHDNRRTGAWMQTHGDAIQPFNPHLNHTLECIKGQR